MSRRFLVVPVIPREKKTVNTDHSTDAHVSLIYASPLYGGHFSMEYTSLWRIPLYRGHFFMENTSLICFLPIPDLRYTSACLLLSGPLVHLLQLVTVITLRIDSIQIAYYGNFDQQLLVL
jgi:hypothetical protein